MIKHEEVYTVDTDTEQGILKAEELQAELYEKYDSVMVYPNGLCQVKIVASNEN